MALLVGLDRVEWTSPSRGTSVDSFTSPFLDPQHPLYPVYESPHRLRNGNRGAELPNRRGKTQHSNLRLINPATGQPISKRAAKRPRAKARKDSNLRLIDPATGQSITKRPRAKIRKAVREAEARQREQNATEGFQPQIQPQVRTNGCGQQANSGWSPQRHPQQNWFTPHFPNHRVSSSAVRVALFPHQSEQTPQIPSATFATVPPAVSQGALVPVTEEHYVRPEQLPKRQVVNSPCSICLDVPDEFPHLQPTSRCAHPPTICATCLQQYISHAVQSQGLTTLTCPNLECRLTMEYADVVRGARNDQACLDRYEALLLRRTLESEMNFVWCKSPTCGWGQVHESGDAAPIVICQACHARSCFTHDVPWHTGLTCEQYSTQLEETRRKAEKASQAYIGRHAKVDVVMSSAGDAWQTIISSAKREITATSLPADTTLQLRLLQPKRSLVFKYPKNPIVHDGPTASVLQMFRPGFHSKIYVRQLPQVLPFLHSFAHAPPTLAPATSAPPPAGAPSAGSPANALPDDAPSTHLPATIVPPTTASPTDAPLLFPSYQCLPPPASPPGAPRTSSQSQWSLLLGRRNNGVRV